MLIGVYSRNFIYFCTVDIERERSHSAALGRRSPWNFMETAVGIYTKASIASVSYTHLERAGARLSGLFFWTVHGPFSFPQVGKETGGCIPAGQAPCCLLYTSFPPPGRWSGWTCPRWAVRKR